MSIRNLHQILVRETSRGQAIALQSGFDRHDADAIVERAIGAALFEERADLLPFVYNEIDRFLVASALASQLSLSDAVEVAPERPPGAVAPANPMAWMARLTADSDEDQACVGWLMNERKILVASGTGTYRMGIASAEEASDCAILRFLKHIDPKEMRTHAGYLRTVCWPSARRDVARKWARVQGITPAQEAAVEGLATDPEPTIMGRDAARLLPVFFAVWMREHVRHSRQYAQLMDLRELLFWSGSSTLTEEFLEAKEYLNKPEASKASVSGKRKDISHQLERRWFPHKAGKNALAVAMWQTRMALYAGFERAMKRTWQLELGAA